MLHTVNKSAHISPLLQHCLAILRPGDELVLLNDGVYGGTQDSPCAAQIEELTANGDCRIHSLRRDAEKRALTSQLLPCVVLIDFPQFVELATQHEGSQSWY